MGVARLGFPEFLNGMTQNDNLYGVNYIHANQGKEAEEKLKYNFDCNDLNTGYLRHILWTFIFLLSFIEFY